MDIPAGFSKGNMEANKGSLGHKAMDGPSSGQGDLWQGEWNGHLSSYGSLSVTDEHG